MVLIIRKAEANDVDAPEAVISQHWKVNTDQCKELVNKDALLLVAEIMKDSSGSRIVVGTALMWVTSWDRTGYIVELAVSKDYSGKELERHS